MEGLSEEELKKKYMEQMEEKQKEAETEAKLDETLRFLLEPKAKERLSNVRLANKELYMKAVQSLLYLAQANQLSKKLSEEDLKALLLKLSEKRETKIVRK